MGVLTGILGLAIVAAADAPQRLFVSGEGEYHTYRIPAIVVSTKGTLLAICEGRKGGRGDSGDIDLLLRRSMDNGATWGPVQVIDDDGPNTCGNPCPIVNRQTGLIILLSTRNIGSQGEEGIMKGEHAPRTVWISTSNDDGATWSSPRDISEQTRKPDWRWYATGPCHGIQLTGGRLVAPCDHSTSPDARDMHSHVIYSDDGGATWAIGGSTEGYSDESTVLERADGSLYLNMRNSARDKRRAYALSGDRGMTWSGRIVDQALIEPVCQGSVLRYSLAVDGGRNRILFSNPASESRENMTVRLSYDEGDSWPVAKPVWPGPAAYSDLVVTADGAIGCLFECGDKSPYETIRFMRFNLEWLTDGKDAL